ncbi:CHAT domain-containing protein [Agromyces sp. NPDC004153]
MDAVMELEIRTGPEPGTYLVEVLHSVGGGEPKATFELDLEELLDRRPALEDSVLSSSVAARRIMSTTEAAIQGVGRQLFDAVFRDDVGTAYRTSLAVASDRGSGVQIVLRLTAPGLAALPWEALFDSETGTYLCRKEPLVRYVPAPYSPPALAVTPPLRVLAMISSPRGLPPLDVEGEKELLEKALRPHLDAGRVRIDWVDEVTWASVHDKLLEREWHVLHFIGHGTYDSETDEGVLAFVGRDGRADYVAASSLADLLAEADPSPRLVLLNSCRSGTGGADDLFSGTAAALVHSGIHAVAAMQFSVSDVAAIEFSRGFYAALAHGRGIDEAVRSGRIGMLGLTRGTLEWVTPVLYLRGEDTRLFEVAPMAEAPADHAGAPVDERKADGPDAAAKAVPEATAKPAPTTVPARPPGPSAAPPPPGRPRQADLPPPTAGQLRAATIPSAPPPPRGAPSAPPISDAPQWRTSQPTARPTAPSRLPRGPGSTRPQPTQVRPDPRPRRKAWLIVPILALVAIGGGFAAWQFLGSTGTAPEGDQEQTSGSGTGSGTGTTTAPPAPAIPPTAEVTMLGSDAEEWTGLSCVANDTFELTATGSVLLNGSEESAVGPAGYLGPEIGYLPEYPAFGPGQLIVGLDTVVVETYSGFAEDGTATYICPNAGDLWLAINDSDTSDNGGTLSVKVWKNPPIE